MENARLVSGSRLPVCRLESSRIIVRLPEHSDAQAIAEFFTHNAEHLAVFSPAPNAFCDAAFWRLRIETIRQEFANDRSCRAFVFDRDDARVIGTANLSEFVRGPFQAAYLGYSLAKSCEGKGIMQARQRFRATVSTVAHQ